MPPGKVRFLLAGLFSGKWRANQHKKTREYLSCRNKSMCKNMAWLCKNKQTNKQTRIPPIKQLTCPFPSKSFICLDFNNNPASQDGFSYLIIMDMWCLISRLFHLHRALGYWGVWYSATWQMAADDGANQRNDWCDESCQGSGVCQA